MSAAPSNVEAILWGALYVRSRPIAGLLLWLQVALRFAVLQCPLLEQPRISLPPASRFCQHGRRWSAA